MPFKKLMFLPWWMIRMSVDARLRRNQRELVVYKSEIKLKRNSRKKLLHPFQIKHFSLHCKLEGDWGPWLEGSWSWACLGFPTLHTPPSSFEQISCWEDQKSRPGVARQYAEAPLKKQWTSKPKHLVSNSNFSRSPLLRKKMMDDERKKKRRKRKC